MSAGRGSGPAGVSWRWRALAGVVLACCAGFTAMGLGRLEFDTSIATFLPPDDPARQAYVEDEIKFGSDPITVVLSGPGEGEWLSTEQLPRVIGLEGELASLENVAVVYGPGTLLNQLAASAQNLLSDISLKRQEVVSTAEQQALRSDATPRQVARAKKVAVRAFDLRYGVLLTRALPAGLPTLSNQAFVDAVSFDGAQPRPTLRFVVPRRDTIALIIRPDGQLTQSEITELVTSIRERVGSADLQAERVLISGSPVVLASLAEQSRREVPLLTMASVVAVGLLLALGARRLRGRTRWLAIVVPLAAAGWAVLLDLALLGWFDQPASLVLVAVLPAVIGIGSDAPHYLGLFGASRRVVGNTIATAAGSAMTALSPVPFIQQLGILLAVGVLAAGVLGLLMRVLVGASVHPMETAEPVQEAHEAAALVKVRRPARFLLAAAACAALAGWLLLPSIPLEADLAGLADGLPAEDEATTSQEILGVSGQADVLLTGDATTPEALAWSREAREAVVTAYGDQLRPILSPTQVLGFLGDDPTPQQIGSAFALVPSYLLAAVLSADGATSSMSFGVVPDNIGEQRRLLQGLRATLPSPPDGAEVVVTGVPAVAAREFELLDSSRLTANLLGVIAPAVLIVVVLGWRYRGDAVRALLAAAIATGLGLLALRLSGTSLTPLTCALGSLTAAVGCEFAVMLRHRAFPWRDVLIAGSTSIAGYLVLLGSELDVMRNFAIVLAMSVVWAGVAAAVVALALPRSPGVVTDGDDSRDEKVMEAVG